ncbi:MAG: N-acetylmuramoyl-L-alanine amidase, partial [Candidatus Eremiobacteraeota bacterium]|nr:N-acetylmuramoyl-L-alanine amidase [Candidatus Eremiobacteraeota bacterium]
FAEAVHKRLIDADLGTKDDGIVKAKYYVVNHTTMPAVLVETAFVSNADDYLKLSSPEWLQRVAQALADAIGDYAGPPGSPAQNLQR